MLYLHCGWPRTGTSSLQAALFERRDELATGRIVYPERWLESARNPVHSGLYGVLRDSLDSPGALTDFERFLAAERDRDVLLSAEGLCNWLLTERKREALLGLLARAQAVMPLHCVWVLRRFDEAWSSLYLLGLRIGLDVPPPAAYLEGPPHPGDSFGAADPDALFAGMAAVEQAVAAVEYLRYDARGSHSLELLRAAGAPAALVAEVAATLASRPRANVSLSHKQAAALLEVDALAARAGVGLDPAAIRAAIERGELRFRGDRRCELLDGATRRALHERALAAASRHGISAYPAFYERQEIRDPAGHGVGPEALGEADLARLLAVAAPLGGR
jgi:hypothetical protein